MVTEPLAHFAMRDYIVTLRVLADGTFEVRAHEPVGTPVDGEDVVTMSSASSHTDEKKAHAEFGRVVIDYVMRASAK